MYEELIKSLREADEKSMCGECGLNLNSGATKKGVLFAQAADAIEELSKQVMALRMDRWDVTCDPEYRESHFDTDEWGQRRRW